MIVAGFGFRTSASMESLRDAFFLAVAENDVAAVATVSDKADTSVFIALGRSLNLPVRRVEPESLTAIDTVTQSSSAKAARNTGSVAEAAALAAAGPGAHLIRARVISSDRKATCALAQTPTEGEPT